MVPGVSGGVVAVQPPAVAEVHHAGVVQGPDPVGGNRREPAEQPVKRVPEGHLGARHEQARIGEMGRAPLVDDDLGPWVGGGDVAGAAGVVQVDVRDHHGRQVAGPDPERGQCPPHDRGRRGGPGLDQARTAAPDQVPGGDSRVPGHPGVDLEDLVTEIGDVRLVAIHPVIVLYSPNRHAGMYKSASPARETAGRRVKTGRKSDIGRLSTMRGRAPVIVAGVGSCGS